MNSRSPETPRIEVGWIVPYPEALKPYQDELPLFSIEPHKTGLHTAYVKLESDLCIHLQRPELHEFQRILSAPRARGLLAQFIHLYRQPFSIKDGSYTDEKLRNSLNALKNRLDTSSESISNRVSELIQIWRKNNSALSRNLQHDYEIPIVGSEEAIDNLRAQLITFCLVSLLVSNTLSTINSNTDCSRAIVQIQVEAARGYQLHFQYLLQTFTQTSSNNLG